MSILFCLHNKTFWCRYFLLHFTSKPLQSEFTNLICDVHKANCSADIFILFSILMTFPISIGMYGHSQPRKYSNALMLVPQITYSLAPTSCISGGHCDYLSQSFIFKTFFCISLNYALFIYFVDIMNVTKSQRYIFTIIISFTTYKTNFDSLEFSSVKFLGPF